MIVRSTVVVPSENFYERVGVKGGFSDGRRPNFHSCSPGVGAARATVEPASTYAGAHEVLARQAHSLIAVSRTKFSSRALPCASHLLDPSFVPRRILRLRSLQIDSPAPALVTLDAPLDGPGDTLVGGFERVVGLPAVDVVLDPPCFLFASLKDACHGLCLRAPKPLEACPALGTDDTQRAFQRLHGRHNV